MTLRRRREVRRNTLVFLGSLLGHLLFFYIVAREFSFYRLPEPPAVQVEIVPEEAPPPCLLPRFFG